MSRFMAVADLHLGAGGDYGRVPGERLAEQEQVWARALELAREHKVDAVLFAGDAFERRRPTPEEILAFERPLLQHTILAGARVIAIPGNHDLSSVDAGCGLDVLAEAGLLDLYRTPDVAHVGDVAVACLPWAPASRLVAAAGGGDRDQLNRLAAEQLLRVARGLSVQTDGPTILLTHFSISGATTPDGADVGVFREPVLDVHELAAAGFDAVIAGHIHRPQTIEIAPPVFYTGSPLPLNFGEAKCDHGAWIVDVADGEVEQTFVLIESRRFVTVDCDGAALSTAGPRVDLCLYDDEDEIRDAIVKVRIRATEEQARRIDVGGIRRALEDAGVHKVWSVQTEVERSARAKVDGLDETVDDDRALEMYLESIGVNGTRATALSSLHRDYVEELRA